MVNTDQPPAPLILHKTPIVSEIQSEIMKSLEYSCSAVEIMSWAQSIRNRIDIRKTVPINN